MNQDQIEEFAGNHFGYDVDAAVKEITNMIEEAWIAHHKRLLREYHRAAFKRKEARRRRVGGRKS